MITFRELALKILAIPSAAYTAGTRFTVAHGLGYTPNVDACLAFGRGTDDASTDNAISFNVVATDATYIYVKPTVGGASSTTGTGIIYVFLDKDDGGRRYATS